MRKLTEIDCDNICDDYLLGLSYNLLSEKYNICTWSIWNVLKKNNIKSRIRKHSCNEDYFEKIDSNEKAYWLGLLFADGYVRKRKQFNGKHKQGGIVGISLKNGDEYLLEKLIIDLGSTYKLTKQIKDEFLSYKLEVNSSKMVDDLIDLGCVPNKSLKLLPPILTDEFISHFIRGYFDGDGSVYISDEKHWRNNKISPVIHFRFIGTRAFLNVLDEKVNLSCRIVQAKGSKVYELSYKRNKKAKLFYNYLYKDATIFLERKKDIFKNHLQEKGSETIIS